MLYIILVIGSVMMTWVLRYTVTQLYYTGILVGYHYKAIDKLHIDCTDVLLRNGHPQNFAHRIPINPLCDDSNFIML